MIAMATETASAKPRRRAAAKTSVRPGASKVKATILLSVEASQRLTIHAAMTGEDRSALVERLIREHLRRFVVCDRGGESAAEGVSAD